MTQTPSSHSAMALDSLDRLLTVTALLSDDMARDLARRGLTFARTEALWIVGERGTPTQTELADALRVTKRNVTGLVDGLESTGFLQRRPHPSDRRATILQLTEKGRQALDQLQADRHQLADQLFAGFDPARLASFRDSLGTVAETIARALAETETNPSP